MKLKDAIEGYLLFKASRASPETIKTDRVVLNQFADWVNNRDITAITGEDVRAYLDYQENERGLSRYTTKRHYASISAMYSWLTAPSVKLAENNPTDMVPAPKPPEKKPKAVDQDTVEGLVSSCKGSRNPRRDKAMVLFLLDTGARATEMATVKIKDVNFTSGKVKVLGKGKKERFVYLGKRALSALWLYVKEERPEPAQVNCKFVFLTIEGYSMDRNSIRRVLYRLSERGCEKRIHPHQLRHTAAIEHLRHGMDLISVQHLLGHRDLKTTRGYLDALTDEDVEARAKRTSPGDNWRL